MPRGRIPKPGNAVGHVRRNHLVAIDGARRDEIPPPPKGLLKRSREAWAALFSSPVAQAIDLESDMPAILRLFEYRDQWLRTTRALNETGLVTQGSMRQLRLSPLAERQMKLERAIADLEAQLGLTPLARLRLGLLYGRSALTAQELNRITREQAEAEVSAEWAEGFTPAEIENGGTNDE